MFYYGLNISHRSWYAGAFETAPTHESAPIDLGFQGLGLNGTSHGQNNDGEWGLAPASLPSKPAAPQSHTKIQTPAALRSPTLSETSKTDPVHSRGTSPAPSGSTMSKEEKAAEMARRKEERKQVRDSQSSAPA